MEELLNDILADLLKRAFIVLAIGAGIAFLPISVWLIRRKNPKSPA